MELTWTTAFLDLPAGAFDEGADYWASVTGTSVSPRRGPRSEFATLRPAQGEPYLKVQAVGGDEPRVHLDLHVEDVAAAADDCRRLGAAEVADHGDHRVLASPGGFTFCLVDHAVQAAPADRVPPPAPWSSGHSEVDQVCLDIAPSAYDREAEFWTALTGWERRRGEPDEFENLPCPPGMPLRILFQRLDDDPGPGSAQDRVTAHLDLACDDRVAEVARHLALGAQRQYDGRGWTTLRDPLGGAYCVTDRQVGHRQA